MRWKSPTAHLHCERPGLPAFVPAVFVQLPTSPLMLLLYHPPCHRSFGLGVPEGHVKLGGIPSHLRKCLLICLSTPSTDIISTSYTVSRHISLGSRPCWEIYAFNFPGRPDLSIFLSQSSTCFFVLGILFLFVRVSSYHFLRHLIGLSLINGMTSP